MKKKFLAVLLALAVLISQSTVVFAYQSELLSGRAQILLALGVIAGDENGDLQLDSTVTRAEFAKMIVMVSPYNKMVASNIKIAVFSDVPPAHWASSYIKVAAENKLLTGNSDSTFQPDEAIQFAQCVTAALHLLGYTDENFGLSWPEGQMGTAKNILLTDGISLGAYDSVSKADMITLLYNLLNTHLKDSNTNYIESIDARLTESCTIIATNRESSSVGIGTVLTTDGTYKIDSKNFDYDIVGKKGDLLIKNGDEFLSFIPYTQSIETYAVYSVQDNLTIIYKDGKVSDLTCDADTVCYYNAQTLTYANVKSVLSVGDVIRIVKDSKGDIDYISVMQSQMQGPFTVLSENWYESVLENATQATVMRNGVKSTLDAVQLYDIAYYSKELNTVFTYNKRVGGIYQNATPNKDAPQGVTVSGTTYTIEAAKAFDKLSSGGAYAYGDSIILLLGRDGGVADVMTSDRYIDSEVHTDIDSDSDEDQAVINADVYSLQRELALLQKLGIVNGDENGEINSTDFVTRAEFAKMAIFASEKRNTVSAGTKISVFADCPSSYWASSYVKATVESGYMNGYTDSKFRPENSVTMAEAVTTLLRILGYADSDFSSVWPSGQMATAQSIELLKNTAKGADEALTREDVMTLIYNALCTNCKNSSSDLIAKLNYSYYDSAVLIATNRENTAVGANQILTSEGSFKIDSESFDVSFVGKKGDLLVTNGELVLFVPYTQNCKNYVVYSVVSDGIVAYNGEKTINVKIAPDMIAYDNVSKSTYSSIKKNLSIGDSVAVYSDAESNMEYISVLSKQLEGPYTVQSTSSWYYSLSASPEAISVMRNGAKATQSDIEVHDIYYYSKELNTAFFYNTQITGIYESSVSSMNTPDGVVISGTEYALEGAAAISKFSAEGGIDYGDTVTVYLGRDGKIADASLAQSTTITGYLVDCGVTEFKNANGESYTSIYAKLALPNGNVMTCATDVKYTDWINHVMTASFSNGIATLKANGDTKTTLGSVHAADMKIGNFKVSPSVNILDVAYDSSSYATAYTNIYLQRLDGMNIGGNNLMYYHVKDGIITDMILLDATGDMFRYGVVTSAKKASADGKRTTGSYAFDVGGSSYSDSGSYYANISAGNVVKMAVDGSNVNLYDRLSAITSSVKSATYTSVTFNDGTTRLLSDNAVIYKLTGTVTYTLLPLSELVNHANAYTSFKSYYDKAEEQGGRIRVIVVKSK